MLSYSPRCHWLLLLIFGFSAGAVQAQGIAELAAELTPLLQQHEGEAAVMLKHLPSGEVFAYRAKPPHFAPRPPADAPARYWPRTVDFGAS
jgi:hypothetical protein